MSVIEGRFWSGGHSPLWFQDVPPGLVPLIRNVLRASQDLMMIQGVLPVPSGAQRGAR
jgi:hypothetical protein